MSRVFPFGGVCAEGAAPMAMHSADRRATRFIKEPPVMGECKSQAPSSKSQWTPNCQLPIEFPLPDSLAVGALGVSWDLELGTWDLPPGSDPIRPFSSRRPAAVDENRAAGH